MTSRSNPGAIGCLIWLAVIVASFAGWITHVVHCIKTQEWLLLIAGAIAAPLGVIHGWGLLFGWW
ncbi:hypothetical protein BAJUN_00350 [Bajunvirus bajun]|uniref:Uncharacterized protein n=1 Tax=Brevundimonas phage vB_BgoS-Bajun TaxID=2948594 RepID=A0A9E7N636_9CAUD|nr:hypothetical protein BAJUN_00350 [Brevundimonas phage vB_BgoS-Bajun]